MASDLNFLPGPTMVRPEVLAQLARPIIGHRTSEFREMMARINPALQRLFITPHPVFTFTCTASAAMEAALANAAGEKALILSNGGFGERWAEAAGRLGMRFEWLKFAWDEDFDLDAVKRKLAEGNFSSMVWVHGETSTGVLNPIEPVSALAARHENLLFIVDAVATLGGANLQMDAWGIDVLVGASQKCLALPPGIVPIGVSARALERSRKSRRRGYAFDFTLWQERWRDGEVVGTPALPQLYALDYQLARILAEPLSARIDRHLRLLKRTHEWAGEQDLRPFGKSASYLPSVSCLLPPRKQDTSTLVSALRRRGYRVDAGYGGLKGQVLRIGHMGEWQEEDLEGLLQALGEATQKGR